MSRVAPMSRRHWSALSRSFLIQGSWNYHHLVGGGFAFALLRVLRHVYQGDEAGFEEALRRHLSLFNTHPYLSSLALGATVRMEEDGADGATIDRFKAAVRGPLGSIGDSLFWAALLPVCLVLALVIAQLGASPWIVAVAFLVPYNGAHLWIRVWGFRHGLQRGRHVGEDLRKANIPHRTWLVSRVGTALLGMLIGLVLVDRAALAGRPTIWLTLAAIGFIAGAVRGEEARRPTWYAFVAAISILIMAGTFQ